MDYEKKYKELVGKIEKAYLYVQTDSTKSVLEEILPELCMSEDERIRKELIDFVKSRLAGFPKCDRFINWLEKQGTSYTKRDVDDAYLKGISDAKNEIDKQYEATYQIRKDIATFIFNYRGVLKDRAKWMDYLGIKVSLVEEQDEKNPQSTKPKLFHEGDWVMNDYCVGKVIALTDDAYLLDTGQGIPFSCEDNAHLWTIYDAKDGDILIDKDNNIGIYNETEGLYWNSYIYLGCDGKLRGFSIGGEHKQTDTQPATKEQCDFLFQKITEAGYEWDAEKKELNKIENEPENYKQQLMSEMTDLIKDYIEQEPVKWREEDEQHINSLLKRLDGLCRNEFERTRFAVSEDRDWLKSLKERLEG